MSTNDRGIKETLEYLLAESKNIYPRDSAGDKFAEIAMQSPANMEIALELVRNQFWTCQKNKQYMPRYPISAHLSPWIADVEIKHVGKIRYLGDIWHVFDVHGTRKVCSHVDEKMKPLPIGFAYKGMPDRYIKLE